MATKPTFELTAEDKTKAAFDSVKRSMGEIANSSLSMKGALSGAFAALSVGGMVAFVNQSLKVADSIDKAAKRAGVAASALQELRFAADQVGASQQNLDEGLKKLTLGLGEFATTGGGPAAAAIKALNIEVRDAAGKVRGTESVFDEITRKLETVESQSQRSALAAKLFGEGAGPDMELLLREGVIGIENLRDAARDLGVVMSDSIIGNAVEAKDELGKLTSVLGVQFTAAILEVTPLLTNFAQSALLAAQEIGGFYDSLLPTGERTNMRQLREDLESLNKEINAYAGQVFRIEAAGGDASGPRRIVDGLREQRQAIMERITQLNDLKKAQKDARESAGELGEGFKGLVGDTKKLTEADKALEKAQADYNKRLQSLLDEIDPTIKATREYMQSVADLDRAWVEGRISGEEYDRLMQLLATDTEAVERAAKDAADAQKKAAEERQKLAEKEAELMRAPFENAAKGVQDAFTDAFENVFNGNVRSFRDLAGQIKQIFVRLAAEIATLLVFRPVVGSIAAAAGLTGSGSALAGTGGAGGFGFNPISSVSNFLGPAGPLLGIGALGGGAIAALTGGNTLGGSIGGSLGFYGGTLLGSGALGGVTGAAVGALGQLGNFVVPGLGLVLGALLGGALGGKPSNKPAIGSVNLGSGSIFGLQTLPGKESAETIKARDALLDVVGKFSGALQQITGGRLSGAVTVDVGERDGTQVLSGPGRGRYANPQQALNAIIKGMLNGVQGVDAQFRQVFARLDTSNLEQAVQDLGIAATIIKRDYVAAEPLSEAAAAIKALNEAFAPLIDNARRLGLATQPILAEQQRQRRLLTSNFNEAIDAAILGITDPLAAALNAFDDIAAERLRNARDLSADLVDVERLNALERQQIVEQYGQQANSALLSANQSIEQFLSSLRSGSGSFLSPNARLANAESEFQALLSAAQGGDVSARSALTGAAGNLLDASRDVFGSSEMFFQRLGFVESTLNNLVGGSSTTTTYDNLGATIATGNAENVYWNQQIVNRLDSLTAALAAQQAALDRLAAS